MISPRLNVSTRYQPWTPAFLRCMGRLPLGPRGVAAVAEFITKHGLVTVITKGHP